MKFLNTPTTQQQVDAIIARDAEQRAGQATQMTRVEHQATGETPRVKHSVTFHYADGTSRHYGPLGQGAF